MFKISPETRKLFMNNMEGGLCNETVYLAQDILDGLTNDKGQALNHLDIKVVSILANAIQNYHEGTVNHD
tara:strand:- start:2365 stop:2574 length:210 start_codon:yes stop_codon:yes gene_type:complete